MRAFPSNIALARLSLLFPPSLSFNVKILMLHKAHISLEHKLQVEDSIILMKIKILAVLLIFKLCFIMGLYVITFITFFPLSKQG